MRRPILPHLHVVVPVNNFAFYFPFYWQQHLEQSKSIMRKDKFDTQRLTIRNLHVILLS